MCYMLKILSWIKKTFNVTKKVCNFVGKSMRKIAPWHKHSCGNIIRLINETLGRQKYWV